MLISQIAPIIEAVPTAIVVVDGSGKILMANAEASRIFGYDAGELSGKPVETLVPGQFRTAHPRMREGYTHDPEPRRMGAGRDLFGLRKDGSEFPVEIGLNPIQTDEGVFVMSAISDLSERKRLEDRLRATIEAAPTAMVMTDSRGTITLVNSETERLFGYPRDSLRGKMIEVLVPTRFRAHHPAQRTQYQQAPEARRMGVGRDLFGLRRDGTEFPIEIGLNPVKTDEGTFVVGAIVDISERTRQANEALQLANEALRRSNEQLERNNIELQRFAYIASHDLQTPMRSIASFIDLLESNYADGLDQRARDWFRRTVNAVHHLQTLVKDLLDYTRIDAQTRPFELVSFREVVDHACSLLDASIRDCDAEISCGNLPAVLGDRSQLAQLMLNLIGNSLKYRGARRPIIQVNAVRQEGEWLFSVRDNGIGIAPQYHQKIFEIFQRLHNQQEYPGTGIGLAVCRRVVHRHNGRIWVESEHDLGSVFHFTIPEPTEPST